MVRGLEHFSANRLRELGRPFSTYRVPTGKLETDSAGECGDERIVLK